MSSTVTSLRKWDVFLSFRGLDTRHNFISFLYKELLRWDIRTFKDDEELESGKQISQELKSAIGESKFAVVVVSVNYAASPWCLNELVKIMELQNKQSITVIPIFYCVNPADLRWKIGEFGEQFKKYEGREEYRDKVESWKQALTDLANISGYCYSPSEDQSDLIDKIAERISKKLDTTRSNGSNLEGIDKHMKVLNLLMELNANRNVKIVGIWARGCEGRSALAKFVYQKICKQFDRHCFLRSVKMISQGRHLSHLKEEFQRRIQGQHSSKPSLKCQKVLLVADDVNTPEQLGALEEEFDSFGPGSVVIITTQDKQLLESSGIEYAYEVGHLTFQNVGERSPQAAFKQSNRIGDHLLRQAAFKQSNRIGDHLLRQAAFKQTDISTVPESDYFGYRRDTSEAYSCGILS